MHMWDAHPRLATPAGFLPGGGRVRRWRVPPAAGAFSHTDAIRVDSGVAEGDEVGTNYDPMIAKLVVTGDDRASALAALRSALAATQVRVLGSAQTLMSYLRSWL